MPRFECPRGKFPKRECPKESALGENALRENALGQDRPRGDYPRDFLGHSILSCYVILIRLINLGNVAPDIASDSVAQNMCNIYIGNMSEITISFCPRGE